MSNEAIHLGDTTDFLELRFLDRGRSPGMDDGDMKLSVAVGYDGFSGSCDEVWIAAHDWAQFVNALSQIDRLHRGEATLVAMSPDEFDLKLQVAHSDAWATVYGSLSKYALHFPTGTVRSRVYYSASVGPSVWADMLPRLLSLGDE
jgi:hypothetical protein